MKPAEPYPHRHVLNTSLRYKCRCGHIARLTVLAASPGAVHVSGRNCHVALREALATAQAERDGAYLRGWRDALADAAKQFEAHAAGCLARAEQIEASGGWVAGRPAAPHTRTRAAAAQAAADLCRSLAERCPQDPQEPTDAR